LINNATKAIEGLISLKAEKLAKEATKNIMVPSKQLPVTSTDLNSQDQEKSSK
jgi:hypothetical protein